MKVRFETSNDYADVHAVVVNAFNQADEADLVEALRSDGDLVVSLVAEVGDAVCGHIGLSALKSPDASLALAPVSVAQNFQGKGVGSVLIREAIKQASAKDFDMIFVLGAPEFYSRFGFSVKTAADFPCDYAGPHFMALQLTDRTIEVAPVEYAKAFGSL